MQKLALFVFVVLTVGFLFVASLQIREFSSNRKAYYKQEAKIKTYYFESTRDCADQAFLQTRNILQQETSLTFWRRLERSRELYPANIAKLQRITSDIKEAIRKKAKKLYNKIHRQQLALNVLSNLSDVSLYSQKKYPITKKGIQKLKTDFQKAKANFAVLLPR